MCDRIDGCPERMRDFLHLSRSVPDLGTVPVVHPGDYCGDGGMVTCQKLSRVHFDCTNKLVHFLTGMAQGITGYVDVMRSVTQTYADGEHATVTEIRAAATRVGTGLPDVAPELAIPAASPESA